jgi:hypothetical protein
MSRFNKIVHILLVGTMAFGLVMAAGCTKKPAKATADAGASSVQEARAAAEDAEKKLGELRSERLRLEKELEAKRASQKGKK